MSYDLDGLELTEQLPQAMLTKEMVQARVEDWKVRLWDLFQSVRAWATANGWKISDSATVRMDEQLLQEFDVPAVEQPTLRLDGDRGYALFKPKGPWVIGANGRIDLHTSKGTFIIVDLAEHGNAPRWTIFRASQKRDGELFSPEMIDRLV